MSDTIITPAHEWRRGWRVAFACFVGFSFFSVMSSSLGVFMVPLTREFGWSRMLASSGIAIAAVAVAILSPLFGILIDRHGSRRLALPGIVIAAVAISSFGLANGSSGQWLLLWGVYAVVSISVKTTVWMAAVVGAFSRSRGLAVGVVLSGTAAASIVVPPLATWLIDQFGWRLAYVWLGCGWGAATFVVCYFFLHDVHRGKLKIQSVEPGKCADQQQLPGLTLHEAKWNTALWRITATTLIMCSLTIGLLIHQVPILIEAGVSHINSAWLASLAGVAGVVGKLISGALLDRFAPNLAGGLTIALAAFAFLLLIEGVTTPSLIVLAMIVTGYAAGSVLQIGSYLTARYAGMRHFGVIYGVVTSFVALGSGIGPMLVGYTYDQTGGYDTFLMVGTAGSVICSLLVLSLPRYPDWETASQPNAPVGREKGHD